MSRHRTEFFHRLLVVDRGPGLAVAVCASFLAAVSVLAAPGAPLVAQEASWR